MSIRQGDQNALLTATAIHTLFPPLEVKVVLYTVLSRLSHLKAMSDVHVPLALLVDPAVADDIDEELHGHAVRILNLPAAAAAPRRGKPTHASYIAHLLA